MSKNDPEYNSRRSRAWRERLRASDPIAYQSMLAKNRERHRQWLEAVKQDPQRLKRKRDSDNESARRRRAEIRSNAEAEIAYRAKRREYGRRAYEAIKGDDARMKMRLEKQASGKRASRRRAMADASLEDTEKARLDARRRSALASYYKNRESCRTRAAEYHNSHRRDTEYALKRLIGQARIRSKKLLIPFDLTLEHIKSVFRSQDGRCALSGRHFMIGEGRNIDCLSIDRVDPAKGYTKSNVRLLTLGANIARHNWGDEALLSLCQDIARHTGRRS